MTKFTPAAVTNAAKPVRRRVLQVDYANQALPDGLRWYGI